MSADLVKTAHVIRNEAEKECTKAGVRFEVADAFLGLDSLLRGAWGSEHLNALGGGKTQIEKAYKVLGSQLMGASE